MKVSILALAVGALFCDKALYSPPSTYGSDAPLPHSFSVYGAVAQHNAYGAVPPHMVTSSGISSNLPQSFAAYGALSQNDLESIPE